MSKNIHRILLVFISVLLLSGCAMLDELLDGNSGNEEIELGSVTPINELRDTDNFRSGALEHILEGELNRKGNAVGFHYDHLPSKKGEILEGTKTKENKEGVYEAEVSVENVDKESNRGRSTFFPDDWDSQDVVDAINEVYDIRTFISGNTYEGLTSEGVLIQMYLDDQERIISAFPIY